MRERLLARLVITPAPITRDRLGRPLVGPCLLWQGHSLPSGYGKIQTGRRPNGRGDEVYIHRAMYEMFVGPIKYSVDHLCRIHNCGSPAHLEDVPQGENVRRGDVALAAAERSRRKTRCKRDHPFDAANTITDKYGRRNCRTCKAEADALYRHGGRRKTT